MEENRSNVSTPRVDSRIVFLESRGIMEGIPLCSEEKNDYCTFLYYDKINIKKVDFSSAKVSSSPLEGAYSAAKASERDSSLQQFIIGFADIGETNSACCYSQERIDEFWDEQPNTPLFFMTMVNLENDESLDNVLRTIGTTFPQKNHLAYLTFDHSDIIIFYRGDSFKNFAKYIFKLNYGSNLHIADSITFFGFAKKENFSSFPQEKFTALLSYGVKNYDLAEDFYGKVEEIDKSKKVEKKWLLGRNDIGILCEEATVQWLIDVRNIVVNSPSDLWYSTYELTVFIEPSNDDLHNKKPNAEHNEQPEGEDEGKNNIDPPKFTPKEIMQKKYELFRSEYETAYRNLLLVHDSVMLRWLKDSSKLSVDLLENPLSFDLGVCLASQFFDLFEYGIKFFGGEGLDRNNADLTELQKRDSIEEFEDGLSTFFADTAIVVDSMNQSNRQFVQVPAFHLPSFEIPPKIMSFYVSIAHSLIDVFHDDKDTTYNLVILPKNTRTLGVRSLAVQDILPKHQWLEMMISEPSFYTMRLTVQTMGHEISHFSGQRNRCRIERKEFMLKCALAIFLQSILQKLPDVINREYSFRYNAVSTAQKSYSSEKILDAAKKIYQTASIVIPEILCQDLLRSEDVLEIMLDLVNKIYTNDVLFESFKNVLWELEESRHDTRSAIDSLKNAFNKQYGIEYAIKEEDETFKAEKEIQRMQVIKNAFSNIVYRMLSVYVSEPMGFDGLHGVSGYYSIDEFYSLSETLKKICYFFSETFADLQTILLFNMKWNDYCSLIRRKEDFKKSACAGKRMDRRRNP